MMIPESTHTDSVFRHTTVAYTHVDIPCGGDAFYFWTIWSVFHGWNNEGVYIDLWISDLDVRGLFRIIIQSSFFQNMKEIMKMK